MKAERFHSIVDAYGVDPARWPEAEREAARAYARTPEGQAVLDGARALDLALAGHVAPLPDAAAFARALKAAEAVQASAVARPRFRLPVWRMDRFRMASGAGLMAAACAGVVFGVTLTDHLTADVQADAVLYQATLNGLDDTEVLG